MRPPQFCKWQELSRELLSGTSAPFCAKMRLTGGTQLEVLPRGDLQDGTTQTESRVDFLTQRQPCRAGVGCLASSSRAHDRTRSLRLVVGQRCAGASGRRERLARSAIGTESTWGRPQPRGIAASSGAGTGRQRDTQHILRSAAQRPGPDLRARLGSPGQRAPARCFSSAARILPPGA